MHRLGPYLKNRDRWLSHSIARKLVITNFKQLEPKKNAEFYEKNYCVNKRIFVKFINKVLPRWRDCENSRVLPSIRSQDGSSSRMRTLSWNCQGEYFFFLQRKNKKNEKFALCQSPQKETLRHLQASLPIEEVVRHNLCRRRFWSPRTNRLPTSQPKTTNQTRPCGWAKTG